EDRGPPPRAHLRQARRHDARRSRALRDAARFAGGVTALGHGESTPCPARPSSLRTKAWEVSRWDKEFGWRTSLWNGRSKWPTGSGWSLRGIGPALRT